MQAVDFALGRFLSEVYPIDNAAEGAKNWCRFMARPPAQKIMRGDFETASDIIRSMEASQKQASQNNKIKWNSVSLPVIAYGRKPNIIVSDPDAGSYSQKTVISENDFRLKLIQVDIEYRIAMLAWDIPTLDQMQMQWMFHVAFEQSKIEYQVKVDGEPMTLTADIIDPKTPAFEDSSLPASDGRVHAVLLPIRARTYLAKGMLVDIPDPIRIHFSGGPLERAWPRDGN
ncbi:MAG: hypothetical protein IBX50_04180 [Marinospirillum sp.]|uniref:hypothetical protein n=1 Tax=Marinospirillum sp. TaxID=2183934 RepID=UPI001A0FEBA1|nr:hypothetical protein [Marinospirillum sp.]MBE0505904.1 hypothetical protein [Marinospirillum sp.]